MPCDQEILLFQSAGTLAELVQVLWNNSHAYKDFIIHDWYYVVSIQSWTNLFLPFLS